MTIDEGALPDLRKPIQRHQQIETDAFCESCGYNLHGQIVERDERLGLMICRCPECGRWHPAGKATTAASLWLARLAALALAMWMLLVLFVLFWIGFGLFAIQVIHVEDFTARRMMSLDGRETEWRRAGQTYGVVIKGTTQPAINWRNVRMPAAQPEWSTPRKWNELGLLLFFDAALGFVSGLLVVTFLWHWRRLRYWLTLLLPFVVAGISIFCMLWLWSGMFDWMRGWVISRVLFYAVFAAVFMGLGILLGRPVARALVRMFIPPRPRQHLAFLWHADGKTMR